jgi:MFS family permease
MACFLPAFVGSSLNVSAPVIGLEFHTSTADMGWLITAFILCSVSMVLPFGRLGDLTSRRALLIIGFIILMITSVIMLFVPDYQWLITLRVIQGVGGACIFSTNIAILTDSFPPEKRGSVLGASVSAVYVGLAIGPVVGGLLTHHFGWRSVFVFIALWATLTAVACIAIMPPNSQRPSDMNTVKLRRAMDMPGCILYLLATSSLAFGLNRIPAGYAWAFTVLGVVLAAIFIFHERRATMPLLSLTLFAAGPSFLLSNFSALLNFASTFAISYLLSIYLQQAVGFGADISGLILITSPAVQAALSPIAGRLSDRYSPFKLTSIGMIICTIALALLLFVDQQTPLVQIVANLVVVGVGFAIFSSPNTNAVMTDISRHDYGIAVSFLATMRNMGQLMSMAIIAIVISLSIGTTPITETDPEQIVSIVHICFAICTVLSAVGILTSISCHRKYSKQ